ncbi:hypothetical protein [Humibacillus xanthopallidus]|uniref:Uncharacterized protein n=1 Tax=Humibacillus xanthopallidus TaxID=412689 RepID=A0A543I3K3_9MICO|nr:hypothetical protein [Humibacillus xanthopallidus]TQM65147.1 hypothetical protein FBY41_1532 [Humibacillus xanthopallidus]
MSPEQTEAVISPRPAKPFLASRTAEWLLATAMGVVLVKTTTVAGVATAVSTLPWAKDFGTLLTFVAPGLDTSAPWISGVALVLCAYSISAGANPRNGSGWWTLDIFVVVLGLYILGPWIAALVALPATVGGLAAAHARGKYWPMVLLDRFMVWAAMGCLSYLVVTLVVNATPAG